MQSRETFTWHEVPVSFKVKLYHPVDAELRCRYSGQAVYVEATAHSKGELRTTVESTKHDFFKGDMCSKCGALAKVSIEKISE